MAAHSPRHRAPRARALAELQLDSLIALSGELARGWAIALIDARPLQQIGELPLAEIAADGPKLCAQILAALQSDGELERLTRRDGAPGEGRPGAAWGLAAIAGAREAAAAADAVEALRGVLWEELASELEAGAGARAAGRMLAEAADRLAHVCAEALAAALAGMGLPAVGSGAQEAGEVLIAGGRPQVRAGAFAAREGALIVDEVRSRPPAPPAPDQQGGRMLAPHAAAIEIRDQRHGEGPGAWVGSITRRLETFARDARPFAVLLLELGRGGVLSVDREHVLIEVERLLAAEAGALTRERAGRFWLLASDTDADAAEQLAGRLSAAVTSMGLWRGAAPEVWIGLAVCPRDGREAATLAAHADVGLYAARAASRRRVGRSVAYEQSP